MTRRGFLSTLLSLIGIGVGIKTEVENKKKEERIWTRGKIGDRVSYERLVTLMRSIPPNSIIYYPKWAGSSEEIKREFEQIYKGSQTLGKLVMLPPGLKVE